MPEESEPRTLTPFKVINRGEDTVVDDQVIFADFSPKVVPSAVADDEIDAALVPKASSAQEPALSPESILPLVLTTSETNVPNPAAEDDGERNQNEPGNLTSSSDPKSGHEEPPA